MNNESIPPALLRLMATDPWMVMMMMTLLTPEQWQCLVTQMAMAELHDQVLVQVRKVLDSYPTWFARKWEKDIAGDVMIKLSEGKFLKRYDPTRKHPMAYLNGCAFQYARTAARSYWRRFGRDVA